MAESVQTGGLHRFEWGGQKQAELDPYRKNSIESGYTEAEERKKKEKINKIMFWIVIALIIVAILGYILLKK